MAKCVEIEKNEDGTFMVTDCSNEESSEGMHRMPGGQMMRNEEMPSQGEVEAKGQQVTTLKDALMAAADILTKGGSTDMIEKQAAFSSADERLTR